MQIFGVFVVGDVFVVGLVVGSGVFWRWNGGRYSWIYILFIIVGQERCFLYM